MARNKNFVAMYMAGCGALTSLAESDIIGMERGIELVLLAMRQ
jgi:hypothetical protein